jgi:hypothetical protein
MSVRSRLIVRLGSLFQEVTSCGKGGFQEDRIRCGLRDHHQLPGAAEQNAFLESHSWEEYAQWHLGLTEGASDQTKARYAFVYGDFRRVHRMGIIACQYRAAEWRHKDIELAAHELLQRLDNRHS